VIFGFLAKRSENYNSGKSLQIKYSVLIYLQAHWLNASPIKKWIFLLVIYLRGPAEKENATKTTKIETIKMIWIL